MNKPEYYKEIEKLNESMAEAGEAVSRLGRKSLVSQEKIRKAYGRSEALRTELSLSGRYES